MNKIISDTNSKSKKIKSFLIKNLKKKKLKLNMSLVIGGDGFMLKTLKKNKNNSRIFYGINSGNYGFLMNKFSKNKTIKNLPKAKMITISPLEMKVIRKNRVSKKYLAINEVSILRQSRQAASLEVVLGKKDYKKIDFRWYFGLNACWKHCYNLSVHGPILSLNSKKLSIAPISPFRPRRWKGKIISDKLKVIINNLNSSKRPISAVADNIEVRNAKSIIVKTNKEIKYNLLYDKNRSLQKKLKLNN